MIGVDTNILVRYLVQDEPAQSKKVNHLIHKAASEQTPLYINQIVLCEFVWVLLRAYHYSKEDAIEALEKILQTREFKIEEKDDVWNAFDDFTKNKADFADCLIGIKNKAAGCDKTFTFDRLAHELDNFDAL